MIKATEDTEGRVEGFVWGVVGGRSEGGRVGRCQVGGGGAFENGPAGLQGLFRGVDLGLRPRLFEDGLTGLGGFWAEWMVWFEQWFPGDLVAFAPDFVCYGFMGLMRPMGPMGPG